MATFLRLSSLAVAVLIAVPGAPASALQITGLSVALCAAPCPTATNSADDLVTVGGQSHSQIASTTSFVQDGLVADAPGETASFLARYASLLAVDRQNTSGSLNLTMTSAWQITFTVDNPDGGSYQIDIDTSRLGALTVVDDTAAVGGSTQQIGAVTGRVDGEVNASLALATVGPFASSATGFLAINQSSTHTILDSALSRTFVLNFDWTGTATSSQDEAAIRLGINGGVTTATADDYPGAGSLNRTQSSDGHFVDVTATYLEFSVPEPEPLTLLTLGLLGLASVSRRARIAGKRGR